MFADTWISPLADNAAIASVVVLGFVAICLLLPRPRGARTIWGTAIGSVALVLAGAALVRGAGWNPETILFYAFSGMAIVAGTLLITQHNPVRAALSFALVVMCTCGLFLLLAAPFLMAATLIVYAGAIVVTFLFVIMLAQQAGLTNADARSHETILSALGGFVLLGSLFIVLQRANDNRAFAILHSFPVQTSEEIKQRTIQTMSKVAAGNLPDDLLDDETFAEYRRLAETARGSADSRYLLEKVHELEKLWKDVPRKERDPKPIQAILMDLRDLVERLQNAHDDKGRPYLPAENVAGLGRTLFTDYFLAIELAGTLLLVATVGAIAIAGHRREGLR